MKSSTPLFRTLCCGLFFLLAAFTAQAQIIYVTPNGAGDQSGSNWSNAAPGTLLQSKINGAASGSQIWVSAGTYKPTTGTDRNASFSMKEGVAIYGGFNGTELQLNKRPAITFSQPPATILSGDIGTPDNTADNSFHVILNNGNNLTNAAVLDGFVITGGNASGDGFTDVSDGGGMYSLHSSPTVRNCLFKNNHGYFGGGLLIRYGNPAIINCSFSNNSATFGGAASVYAASANFFNCSFSNNSAGSGGAVENYLNNTKMVNCTFAGNIGGFGTALLSRDAGNLTLVNCVVWGNTGGSNALAISGGGYYTVSYSDIDQDGFAGQNGNISQDPLFTNAANGDLHLKPNSPVINQGDNSANSNTTDLDGNTRKYGVIDMGAYEYQCDPTVITAQPQNTSGCTSGTATFTVGVTGPNLTYKWHKEGQSAGSGSNSSTLTISNVTTADAGSYEVDIISDCGTVTSNAATLTVNAKPVVTVPANITIGSGETSCEAPVPFVATATGMPAPSIIYKIGETPVTSPYTFPVGTTTVTVVATNTCGTDSKTFTVTVQDKTPPVFTAPVDQNILLGANCSLTIPDLTSGLIGSDNCSNAVTFTQLPVAGTIVNSGYNQTQVVTITADDGHGNTTSHNITLTAKDNTLPAIMAPAAITVSTDAGICSASHVALGTPRFSDNCSAVTVINNAPAVFPKGTTTVTWTATDASGNKATAIQTITVSDNEKPVITCPAVPVTSCYDASGTYTIPTLSATDNCGTTNTAYTISGATIRNGTGNNASGPFYKGTSTITWTVKDESGNTSTCQTTVVINALIMVSIADVKVLSSGVNVNTVYVGYSPAATATLTASVSGGSGSYTYQWSTGANTASIKVSPAVTTTYTVTIRDNKGCTATAAKQIKLIDASCGTKVNVCHSGKTLCIDKNSVSDHLGHGDYLGACTLSYVTTEMTAGNKVALAEQEMSLSLNASPNPSSNYFTLHINGNATGKVVLTIVDAVGRVVEKREMAVGQAYQVGTSYRPGVYFVHATQGNKTTTLKLIKQAW